MAYSTGRTRRQDQHRLGNPPLWAFTGCQPPLCMTALNGGLKSRSCQQLPETYPCSTQQKGLAGCPA